MAWKKVPPERAEFIAKKVAALDCEPRKMFGCPAYFVNGNVFAGVNQDTIILRLSEADRREFFAAYEEAGQFEPMKGRKMREYAAVPPAVSDDDATFDRWLWRSFAFASSLPAKEPKTRYVPAIRPQPLDAGRIGS